MYVVVVSWSAVHAYVQYVTIGILYSSCTVWSTFICTYRYVCIVVVSWSVLHTIVCDSVVWLIQLGDFGRVEAAGLL